MGNATAVQQINPIQQSVDQITDATCLLAIDSRQKTESIRCVLSKSGMNTVKSVANLNIAAQAALSDQPDLIIADAANLEFDPIVIASSLRKKLPDIKIILLFDQIGLKRFLHWSSTQLPDEITGIKPLLNETLSDGKRMIGIIERLLSGNDLIESELVDLLIRGTAQNLESLSTSLSKRELEVLAVASTGAVNNVIAEQLEVSPTYIGNILSQIFSKLGLRHGSEINPRVMACRQYFLEFGVTQSG